MSRKPRTVTPVLIECAPRELQSLPAYEKKKNQGKTRGKHERVASQPEISRRNAATGKARSIPPGGLNTPKGDHNNPKKHEQDGGSTIEICWMKGGVRPLERPKRRENTDNSHCKVWVSSQSRQLKENNLRRRVSLPAMKLRFQSGTGASLVHAQRPKVETEENRRGP